MCSKAWAVVVVGCADHQSERTCAAATSRRPRRQYRNGASKTNSACIDEGIRQSPQQCDPSGLNRKLSLCSYEPSVLRLTPRS